MCQLEKDYAPLCRHHIPTLHALAQTLQPCGADIIIASPYTRALQTAEILNRPLGLPLYVEHDIREWQADVTGGYLTLAERDRRWACHRTDLQQQRQPIELGYESWQTLKARTEAVLARYQHYNKVILVSHFNVFESLVGYQEQGIPCGGYRLLKR